jgi:hypothetical protein
VWRMHSGYNISNPMRLTVAADGSTTLEAVA